jgi:hypothetical protein
MSVSQGGPAHGALFGVVLLFAVGAAGFYLLTEVARRGHTPTPPYQSAPLTEEAPPPEPDGRDVVGKPAAEEPVELPDPFFVPATMMTGALPTVP